jgi:hypothetical protein
MSRYLLFSHKPSNAAEADQIILYNNLFLQVIDKINLPNKDFYVEHIKNGFRKLEEHLPLIVREYPDIYSEFVALFFEARDEFLKNHPLSIQKDFLESTEDFEQRKKNNAEILECFDRLEKILSTFNPRINPP